MNIAATTERQNAHLKRQVISSRASTYLKVLTLHFLTLILMCTFGYAAPLDPNSKDARTIMKAVEDQAYSELSNSSSHID